MKRLKATILSVTQQLVSISQQAEDFDEEDTEITADLLQNIVSPRLHGAKYDNKSAINLVKTFSNLLSVGENVLIQAERHKGATSSMVRSIEQVSSNLQLETDKIIIVEPNIALSLANVNPLKATGMVFGVKRSQTFKPYLKQGEVVLLTNTSDLSLSGLEVAIALPSSLFTRPGGASASVVQTTVYNSNRFFEALQKAAESNPNSTTVRPTAVSDGYSNATWRTHVNSKVIAASVAMQRIQGLNDPVMTVLKHIQQKNARNPRCVFWSFVANGGQGGWSTEGCHLNRTIQGQYSVCQCDHLTNFALLMDIYGTGAGIDKVNRQVLSIISYIGCAVSLAGLTFTLITHALFRKLRKDIPSKILINLCVALLMVIVLFILGTQWFIRGNFIACKIFAGVLHYSLLASMLWMSVEAFYMYLALVRVFQTYYSRFMLKCGIIAWGVPLVVVAIVIGISRDNYAQQGEICWLSRYAFFGAFLAPVGIVLTFNIIVFIMVIYQLQLVARKKMGNHRQSSTLAQLRGVIGIMVLLGLTWLFAVFAIREASIVFQYLFAVFNSLQGLFIFVFYCLLKQDVQRAWMTYLPCCPSPPDSSTSSGRAQTGSTPLEKAQPSKLKAAATAVVAAGHLQHNAAEKSGQRPGKSKQNKTTQGKKSESDTKRKKESKTYVNEVDDHVKGKENKTSDTNKKQSKTSVSKVDESSQKKQNKKNAKGQRHDEKVPNGVDKTRI